MVHEHFRADLQPSQTPPNKPNSRKGTLVVHHKQKSQEWTLTALGCGETASCTIAASNAHSFQKKECRCLRHAVTNVRYTARQKQAANIHHEY